MEFPLASEYAKKVPRKGTGLYYDPLYGYVPLPYYLREAMDLDVFQRLQGIKQLSTVYLTFRGAVHTRFDHCVGTAYLASMLFNRLRELGELFDKSDTDTPEMNSILEASISLAALFHDVGHGPFGHIFEMFCRRDKKSKDWDHERMARKLITGKDESEDYIDYEPYKQIRTVLEKIKA
ncbi:MAG: HD domain-containing protein, partial [Planctomycetota bacterium]|nr:HD domain-containing protein [Planctomycetota bacterium]